MKKVIKKVKFQQCVMVLFALLLIGTMALKSNQAVAADSHPYLIKVNRQMNCITIYEKDKNGEYTVPIKAMTCSTGGSNTLLGTYKTPAKYRWKLLMGDVWGQYSTRIVGGILFHSVWYYEKDPSTLSARQYNKLGSTASHGCIRLSVIDAKWIYDNCPLGTTVIIYDSKDPGPLGKPEALKVPSTTGWDPTDPNSQNPWKNKKPTIQGAKNKTISYGSKVDLLSGVTAKSSTGFYISKLINVSGKVNVKKAGTYKVTYKVTEASGKTAKKTVTYTVKADNRKATISGVKDQTVNGSQTIDRTFALKGVSAKIGDTTVAQKNIKVKITKNSDTKYTINYSVTASNGNVTKAKSIITVDNEAPVISGVEDRYISVDQEVNESFALKGVSATDNGTKLKQSSIKVSISYHDTYYKITYKVTDSVGNVTKKTATYTIIDGAAIIGAKDQTVTSDVTVDETFARKGVTAYIDAVEANDSLVISISDIKDDKYTITYSLTDHDGYTEEVTVTITVTNNIVIYGATDREISSTQDVTEKYALNGVTAKEGSIDLTDKLSVVISKLVDNKYTVTYSVTDSKGFVKEVTVTFTVK